MSDMQADILAMYEYLYGPRHVPIDKDKETFIDGYGTKIVNVHRQADCSGKCAIHNHSSHPLSDKLLLWRNDRGIFEHICKHGIGHVCKDSIREWEDGVHGCDGCCHVQINTLGE